MKFVDLSIPLINPDELIFGTNPLHFDTDLDGLDDSTEINFRSDPNLIDTDFEITPFFRIWILSARRIASRTSCVTRITVRFNF